MRKMSPSIGYMKRADNDTLSEDDVRFIVHSYTTSKVKPSNSQAIALVKKFRLRMYYWNGEWRVSKNGDDPALYVAEKENLNSAICKYVAKMQAKK